MIIDEEFLTENNITQEEYEAYYNSLEAPNIKKVVNEFGLITLTADNVAISFREEDLSEEEATKRLENRYYKSKTNVHFLELTRQQQKANEEVEEEIEVISPDEKWKNDVTISLEYLTCLAELSVM